MDFPYISVLVTGAHTELVLTQGVGMHTIFGMTQDTAIGNCVDSLAVIIQ